MTAVTIPRTPVTEDTSPEETAEWMLGGNPEVTSFRAPELLFFEVNYTKVPNSFVDLLMLLLTPQEFRVVLNVWRNTYGRRGSAKVTRNAMWEPLSGGMLGRKMGFKTFDPKTRGLNRSNMSRLMKKLVDSGLLISMNPHEIDPTVYGAEEPNQYALGHEVHQLLATGDVTWQFRAACNTDAPESKPTYRGRYQCPVNVSEKLWKALDYGRAPLAEIRAAGVKLQGENRTYLKVTPPPRYVDICENRWFQMPIFFEDLLAPNVPIALYPFLVYILRETFGKYQFKIDRNGSPDKLMSDFEKTRHFISYERIADMMGVSVSSAKRMVKWARNEGLLDVRTRKEFRSTGSANGYVLGPEIVRMLFTGDFSYEYRTRNSVSTKPSHAVFMAEAYGSTPQRVAPDGSPDKAWTKLRKAQYKAPYNSRTPEDLEELGEFWRRVSALEEATSA